MSQDHRISGFTLARNCFNGDYCLAECIDSMLPVCDEVIISDGGSTDGTLEYLQRRAEADPRIRVVHYEWKYPKGDSGWFTAWINSCREHLSHPIMLQLDSDEILDSSPECHAAIAAAARDGIPRRVDRLNYWKHIPSGEAWLVPDGHLVGKWVVRIGPSKLWLPSDEPHHEGELEILDKAIIDPLVVIHHVGFMRRSSAFYRKSRILIEGFFTRWDQRLEFGEREGKELWETTAGDEYKHLLTQSAREMPDSVQLWLSERGHRTEKYLARLPIERQPHIEIVTEQRQGEPLRILHSGDFGDLLMACPTFRAIGNVDLFLVDRSITKPLIRRMAAIEPLLSAQPYINSVQVYEGGPIDWNASEFRTMYNRMQSLGQSHLLHYRGQKHLPAIEVDFQQPWLTAGKDTRAMGRVVINRTARYHNAYFPWRELVQHYGELLVFVGTTDEHTAFVQEFGEVEYMPTGTMIEVAHLIAGSALFCGNQSAANAIAEGLKHPRIQETSLFSPDCIYGGATYCIEGSLVLPDVCGKGRKEIPSRAFNVENVNRIVIPKGGWQYNSEETGPLMTSSLESCARDLRRKLKKTVTIQEAERMVLCQNVQRVPRHFARDFNMEPFVRAHTSLKNAAVANHPVLAIMQGNINFNT